jgi:hypothetical protein
MWTNTRSCLSSKEGSTYDIRRAASTRHVVRFAPRHGRRRSQRALVGDLAAASCFHTSRIDLGLMSFSCRARARRQSLSSCGVYMTALSTRRHTLSTRSGHERNAVTLVVGIDALSPRIKRLNQECNDYLSYRTGNAKTRYLCVYLVQKSKSRRRVAMSAQLRLWP